MKPKLVVFDLNKTLIKENSWLELNLAMGVTQQEDDELMELGKAGMITDAEAQLRLAGIYRERGNPTRHRIMEVLKNYTYLPDAQRIVSELRDSGVQLALLSGSMNILVDHIADELGITMRAANNHFVFTGDTLSSITTDENDDLFKIHQVERWCDEIGIALKDVACIGDGANDLLLFENCGMSVTFTDSPYREKATHTIRSLNELPDVLVHHPSGT